MNPKLLIEFLESTARGLGHYLRRWGEGAYGTADRAARCEECGLSVYYRGEFSKEGEWTIGGEALSITCALAKKHALGGTKK